MRCLCLLAALFIDELGLLSAVGAVGSEGPRGGGRSAAQATAPPSRGNWIGGSVQRLRSAVGSRSQAKAPDIDEAYRAVPGATADEKFEHHFGRPPGSVSGPAYTHIDREQHVKDDLTRQQEIRATVHPNVLKAEQSLKRAHDLALADRSHAAEELRRARARGDPEEIAHHQTAFDRHDAEFHHHSDMLTQFRLKHLLTPEKGKPHFERGVGKFMYQAAAVSVPLSGAGLVATGAASAYGSVFGSVADKAGPLGLIAGGGSSTGKQGNAAPGSNQQPPPRGPAPGPSSQGDGKP